MSPNQESAFDRVRAVLESLNVSAQLHSIDDIAHAVTDAVEAGPAADEGKADEGEADDSAPAG